MGSMATGAFRPNRGWTLNLGGESMMGVHCPISEAIARPFLPSGFEAQVYEGQRYLSVFSGHLSRISFFAGIEIPLSSPCCMVGIPVIQSEMRGWLVLQIGITDTLAHQYSQRFLNLPMGKQGWAQPTLNPKGGATLHLPRLDGIALPSSASGAIRPIGFKAQPDSLDAFLTSQPNFLWQPSSHALQMGPVYLPPMKLQRIELDKNLAEDGYLAHYMQHWETIAWRPQRIRLRVPDLAR